MKRFLAIFMMLIFLVGCGEVTEEVSGIWRAEPVAMPEDFDIIMPSLCRSDGGLHLSGRRGESDAVLTVAASGEVSVEIVPAVSAIFDGGSYQTLVRTASGYTLDERSLDELFGMDLTSLRQSVSGEGGFQLFAAGMTDSAFYAAANIGIACLRDGYDPILHWADTPITGAVITEDGVIFQSGGALFSLTLPGTPKPLDIRSDGKLIPRGDSFALIETDGIRSADGGMLCDFVASDITSCQNARFVDEELFILGRSAFGGYELLRCEPLPADVHAGKTILTLAAVPDCGVRDAVTAFNRESADFRIMVTEYPYDVNERGIPDYSTAFNRLHLDIAAGNLPDIITFNCDLAPDLYNYVKTGLFADLYPLMDADPDFSREMLLECQTESFTVDGKLPYIASFATVQTLIGDGESERLTLESALDLIETMPEGRTLYDRFMPGDMVHSLLMSDIDRFLDGGFSQDVFIRFLNVYKNFTRSSTYDSDARPILRCIPLSGMFELATAQVSLGADSITAVGFPDETGSGARLVPREIIGVGGQSENKQAAWSFIRRVIDDERLKHSSAGIVPVTKSALDAAIDGEKGSYYWVGYRYGGIISESPFTEETLRQNEELFGPGEAVALDDGMAENLQSIIESARARPVLYDKISVIIEEELSAFVSNDSISPEQTAGIIESRVNLLLSEQED